MKRPSFQFYPGDWRRDPALCSCSMAARGLWIDMICIAHESEEYGVLSLNRRPMTVQQIARVVGSAPAVVAKLIDELESSGVFSRNDQGSIFSRRMVKDEAIRNTRAAGGEAGKSFGQLGAEHGRKGGRPRKETGDSKTPLKTPLTNEEKPPPSSSSSSSSSSSIPNTSTRSAQFEPPDAPDGAARASPSMAAAVCMVLKAEGIASVNPGHPDLKALIEAGADAGMFASAGKSARERGKGFAYVLGTVRGQMRDAAATAESGLSAASAASEKESETPYQRSMRLRMEEVAPSLARPAPGIKKPAQIVEIYEAPPLRLEA